MKVLSTDGLTKLIQLIKSAFISVDDTETTSEIDTVITSEITLATVATSGKASDLNNDSGFITSSYHDSSKANIDLSNCTKPYITETYINGTSWYRLYSDGWCEQGGTLNTGLDSKVTVTYPTPFAQTPQIFIGRLCDTDFPTDVLNKRFIGIADNVSTTSFETWGEYGGYGSFWFAVGFVS